MTDSNPLASGALALVAGDILGSLVDHVGNTIDSRIRAIPALHLADGTASASLLDTGLALFVHSGLMIMATEFATSALPWMTEDTSSFVLFLFGLWATSPTLIERLKDLNRILLEESYSRQTPHEAPIDS